MKLLRHRDVTPARRSLDHNSQSALRPAESASASGRAASGGSKHRGCGARVHAWCAWRASARRSVRVSFLECDFVISDSVRVCV